jgi:hypothetical protein
LPEHQSEEKGFYVIRHLKKALVVDVDDSDGVGRSGTLPPAGDANNGVTNVEESLLDAEVNAVLEKDHLLSDSTPGRGPFLVCLSRASTFSRED